MKHHAIKNIREKQYLWNWTRCYSENLKTKKTIKQKKRRAMHVTKKIIMSEIANRKTLFDDNSTLYWKNNSKRKQKKWKYIDYKTIEISFIDFENENFFKIDESHNFQNILSKTKRKNIFMTINNVNKIISTFEHKSVIEYIIDRFKIFYSNSIKKIKIDIDQNCSSDIDSNVSIKIENCDNFSNAENTINRVIDMIKKILNNNASTKMKINYKMKQMIKTLKQLNRQKLNKKMNKITNLCQSAQQLI